MKTYTESELKNKAEAYCAAVERCPSEVSGKLRQWGASDETIECILDALVKNRYVDTLRYCRAFVRDKYRFNQWGRIKISKALKIKGLSPRDIEEGLQEIDEKAYLDNLTEMLRQKARSVHAASTYERNARLTRYALGKGFTLDEALKASQNIPNDESAD